MADYKRLVSYIYAYPGGVRDKNVGFAKAEVRNGQFKLTVSVKGVYTDTPELFGVYVMVDGKKHQPGGFTLLKTGTVMVNQGIGQYQDLFNPMNINQSGYTFEDISGIALARENEDFYRMFSLWEDCILNTEDITFAQPEAAAASNPVAQADSEEVSVKEQVNRTTGQEAERKSAEMSGNVRESETVRRNAEDVSENEVEEAAVTSKPATPESAQSAGQQADLQQETAQMKAQQVRAMEAVQELLFRNTNPQGTMPQNTKLQDTTPQNAKPQEEMPAFEKVFINRDFIDAFEDDYFYDCVEVTPELLKQLPIEDDAVVNNSFLVHGYYNFKHILFGKVCENDNNTRYFIGVPGMYCNRERFMASMFGFCNFKKSHRSDYSNPYFGYWYQEI
ncbi:DUF6128 domain-containing protein [Lachnospira pectinoschiza]|jgi:hypothetical protein|uniref:DUF6128 domain-containing protein n=1 Tax=Lachnospira pectinoschiza TaxID=28052 RepID=UPI001D08FF29|nr:DUF6128 domain-containing protein [Lachnospira pectinoschiza]MCB6144054.1 DUF6128 domain-containing protein [Lachnospira pectinoschiza]